MAAAGADAPAIVVGRVRKPHGLKGEVAVFPLTDQPEAIFVPGRALRLLDLGGEPAGDVVVAQARGHHREWLIRFEGRDRREAVEELRQLFLAVPRSEMAPLGDGEVYQRELIGWSVRDVSGAALGIVSEVYELPQGPTIEVQGPRREFLLPYRAEYVTGVDREARRLTVRVPDGLLDQ